MFQSCDGKIHSFVDDDSGVKYATSGQIAFIDSKKICFTVYGQFVWAGTVVQRSTTSWITVYPQINNDESLKETDTITIHFNHIAESLAEDQADDIMFMLKPGRGKETVHK